LGAWEQDGSVFADLRNSKDEAVRIFYDRLESYEYESNWPSVTNLKG
jgi:hypothetical protein